MSRTSSDDVVVVIGSKWPGPAGLIRSRCHVGFGLPSEQHRYRCSIACPIFWICMIRVAGPRQLAAGL